ncbi:MAG: FAD binding domain-containing protein [Candidatus Hydrogenedentes bacterium]|nr:FAD binding domain-containing protein [Candidatus Hydrogenedentota bacterium]
MNAFEYARPASVAEAVELLGASWDDAAVLAGGTDLITCLKQHVMAPKRLVSLRDVPELKGVAEENGRAHIGAMTTLAELAADPLITQHFPALVAAAQGVGSPQIMAAGTVGGDLLQRPRCWYFRTEHGLFAKEGDTALVPAGDNRYHAIFGNDSVAFVCPSSLAPSLVALDATVVLNGPAHRYSGPP